MITAILHDKEQAKTVLAYVYRQAKPLLVDSVKLVVTVKKQTRSTAQNARMWAMLEEISKQVEWYGNWLTPEEWKDVMSAGLKRTKVVPGIDGGMVICGQSTSKMTIAEMCELQELMEAFGVQHDVQFKPWREE